MRRPALAQAFRARRYFARTLAGTEHERASDAPLARPDVLDLVTIAFNAPWVVEVQVEALRDRLADAHEHTVLDNSSDDGASREIAAVCRAAGTPYVRLPPPPSRTPSENHGYALTWAWRNHLRPRGATHVGFLDHDVFPLRPTTLVDKIDVAGAYGHPQERDGRRYLWPGFCFFRRDALGGADLDFVPAPGLDTGGRLAPLLDRLGADAMPELPARYERLRPGDDPQADWVEHLGDWVHVINGSNWKRVADKRPLVEELLRRYEVPGRTA